MEYVNLSSTATWHEKGNPEPCQFSDVFFTYDHGESSDWGAVEGIPDHIWEQIESLIKFNGFHHCLVWVSNYE